MRFSTLVRAAFVAATATVAAATGAEIVSALNNVDSETLKLQNIVQSWNGHLLSSIPIVTQSAHVLVAIKQGDETADNSAELTVDEALSIATAVNTVAATVNSTMTALISRHGDFRSHLIAPIVLLDLKTQKSASDKMSAAIVAKVPSALQAIAQNLAAPISASFSVAIDAYSISNGI